MGNQRRVRRPAVGKVLKRQLVGEAGGKCANPGCANRLIEMHHIRHWRVQKTHDGKHMIALCPACHDSVERGHLRLTDETLYRWKSIPRQKRDVDNLYIEPASSPKLLLGTIALSCAQEVIAFELSPTSRLKLRVADGEFTRIDLTVSTPDGVPLLQVVENDVRVLDGRARYARRTGRLSLTAPNATDLVPSWALTQIRTADASFGDPDLTLLDLEVLEPGLVRVQGIWAEADRAVIVTSEAMSFLTRGAPGPKSITGEGKDSVITYVGPVSIGGLFERLGAFPPGVVVPGRVVRR